MNYNQRGGCLGTILQFLLLGWLFEWLERRFGWGRGTSCTGCGCGLIILIVFIILVIMTLTGQFRLFNF